MWKSKNRKENKKAKKSGTPVESCWECFFVTPYFVYVIHN